MKKAIWKFVRWSEKNFDYIIIVSLLIVVVMTKLAKAGLL